MFIFAFSGQDVGAQKQGFSMPVHGRGGGVSARTMKLI